MEDEDESMGSGGSGSEDEPQVESLVAGRQKRSTAANRYSALLQNEEPDDEVNMLFQEEEGAVEDTEFVGEEKEGASDVDMDSDDDEDDQGPTAGADDLSGEKEVEKQERAERRKKRKDQLNFKGRLNLKPRVPRGLRQELATNKSTPEPRPKKKSERISWLPTPDDGPVRSSSRRQTVQNKEVIHERMKASEKKRKQQAKAMEAAQKRREADKPKQLSQADRMAEAHKIEKQNAKSLNRWEAEEKKRAEERQAKLDALKNRKLEGPVITYWSGPSAWLGDRLVSVGTGNKIVEIKEPTKGKPGPKPKVKPGAGTSPEAERPKSRGQDVLMADAPPLQRTPSKRRSESTSRPAPRDSTEALPKDSPQANAQGEQKASKQEGAQQDAAQQETQKEVESGELVGAENENPQKAPDEKIKSIESQEPSSAHTGENQEASTVDTVMSNSSSAAAPKTPQLDPKDTKESQPSNLVTTDHSSAPDLSSNQQDTGSLPQLPNSNSHTDQSSQSHPTLASQEPPSESTSAPAMKEVAARTLIILENVDGAALALPSLRNHILLKSQKAPRRTAKEQKSAAEVCLLTGQPAHFCDPRTGLAYSKSTSYKQIQILTEGKCKWSNLLGCYVGRVDRAARGVPDGWWTGREKRAQEENTGNDTEKSGKGKAQGSSKAGK